MANFTLDVEILETLVWLEVRSERSAHSSEYVVAGKVASVNLAVDRDCGMYRDPVNLRQSPVTCQQVVVSRIVANYSE